MPDADGGLDSGPDGRLAETMGRVVAGLDVAGLDDVATKNVRYAVAFANRFKGHKGRDTSDTSAAHKRYARETVVPAVAAAAATALPGAATVDLRDPDVTFFAEVLSVAAGGADGPEAGGFVERLAIGAAAKRDGVFELKRGAIRPVALKRASGA
jgi:hypothetical protein